MHFKGKATSADIRHGRTANYKLVTAKTRWWLLLAHVHLCTFVPDGRCQEHTLT